MPNETLPNFLFNWWDKFQHLFAFFYLIILRWIAYGTTNCSTFLALSIFGGGIEFLQLLIGWRNGDFYDWMSDLLGLLIGYVLIKCIVKIKVHFSSSPPR